MQPQVTTQNMNDDGNIQQNNDGIQDIQKRKLKLHAFIVERL
jgi:hypothetical protein